MAVNVPWCSTVMLVASIVTSAVNWRAYGSVELQPGSSMNVALRPGVTHSLNSITCSLLFTASPGARSLAEITCVMSSLNGANVLVTRPGAGNAHAHDTNPEQSERYG